MAHDPANKDQSNDESSKSSEKKAQQSSSSIGISSHRILTRLSTLVKKRGVHTANYMNAAGFKYTGDGDTARCEKCGLEVSNWTLDMIPFDIHSKKKPQCSFVRATIVSSLLNAPASSSSTTIEHENPSKRKETEPINSSFLANKLVETDILQQVRRRTFSHWPHRTIPSSAQMIEAGFFNCNVGDRVICIYCNLICQEWTPHTDDPCEVHKTLSPQCIYVKAKLIHPVASSIVIINEHSIGTTINNHSPTTNNLNPFRSNEITNRTSCNPAYAEISKRHASFDSWPNENLPPVDDLVRAGFFYTGTNSIVTCFYCNGSLQKWGPNDNPMIEHARWFPNCAYAKQLCGDELYQKIQESQQKHANANKLRGQASSNATLNTNVTANSRQLLIPDESTLSRLVSGRLDLPISQSLLERGFKLAVVVKCWQDQLRLKHDDFVSDCDLFIACIILQKQIEYIGGKKENIVIPSMRMKQIIEQGKKEQAEILARLKAAALSAICNITPSITTNITSESTTTENEDKAKIIKSTTSVTNDQHQSDNSTPFNPCVLCLTEEKRIACIPCGHLATCVPCSHSLQSCPICRRGIDAFVRIYI